MSLLTAVSSWYLIGCLLIGVLYALLLYYRSGSKFSQAWFRFPLAVLRGSVVALIVLLLFNPYLKSEQKVTEKPLVILAVDNSQSLVQQADSVELAEALAGFAAGAVKALSEEHDLRLFSFGGGIEDSLKYDFSAKSTDISGLFQQLEDRYSGNQLAAVVLLSDGIFNRGFDPTAQVEKLGVPVYTVPLGDTTVRQDIAIKGLRANQVVYINSDFTILADIEASRLQGQKANLKLELITADGPKLLAKETVSINKDRFFETVQFVIGAEKAGVNRYRITADLATEAAGTAANNSKDIFVEVIDESTQILLVAHAPHPDISTIKQALEVNPQHKVQVKLASQPVQISEKPDLVILHQLPSPALNATQWLQAIEKLQTPIWYILGSQTNLQQFNRSQNILEVSSRAGGLNKVQTDLNPSFRLFNLENSIQEKISGLPPLDAPFGDFRLSPQASPLLYQRIGNLPTDMPLLAYASNSNPRMAFLAGEGLWRWQLAQAGQKSSTDVPAELIRKTVQFLTIKQDKRPFQVRTNRKLYPEQENILFEAELYNQSFEAVNEPDVRLLITDENQRSYNFTLGRTQQQYFLNVGALPPGAYSYSAKTQLAGSAYQANGSFVVTALDLEKTNTVANHALLASIAALSGGEMLPLAQQQQLFNLLQDHESLKPVVYYEMRIRELISLETLLLVIGLLLALEWFIRRYAGSY